MNRDNSSQNFHKKQVMEKLHKLENDINILKEILVEIQGYIIKVDKKTPLRTKGWIFGDTKTYDD